MDPKSASFVTCANIRSRHQPAVKCTKKPTHGEFCFRHWKKPIRYFDRNQNDQSIILTRHLAASDKIKKSAKAVVPPSDQSVIQPTSPGGPPQQEVPTLGGSTGDLKNI